MLGGIAVNDAIMKCLAKDPADRPQTVDGLAERAAAIADSLHACVWCRTASLHAGRSVRGAGCCSQGSGDPPVRNESKLRRLGEK